MEELKQKLVYEVCDIEVVLPEETQILGAEPDRDLVTLLTCTPYGQNTHRLLVTGQRIADDAQTDVAHKADNRQRRGWKSQWMTSYAKAVCFRCRDTVCSILCMQGCSYRSDTEEKEYDVRSEVTEFRNEQSR